MSNFRFRFRKVFVNLKKYKHDFSRYLWLVIFPLVLGLALLLSTRFTIGKQMEKYGELQVDYLAAIANSVLDETSHTAQLAADDSSIRASLESKTDIIANASSICERVRFLFSQNNYVKHIYIIDTSNDQILDQYGRYTYESGFALFASIDKRLAEDPTEVSTGWNVVNENYAPPYYVTNIASLNGDRTIATLVVVLDQSTLYQLLYSIDADFCCLFNDKCEITTLFFSHESVDWHSEREVSRLLGEPVKCTLRDGGTFTYLVAERTFEYYRPLYFIVFSFGVYFLAVFMYGILHLIKLTWNRYNSINEIVDTLSLDISENSRYDDLLRSIRMAFEEYREKDKSAREILRERNLRYLLQGRHNGTYGSAADTGIEKAENYYVAVLFVSDYGDICEEGAERGSIIDIIFHRVLSQFKQPGVNISSVDMYPNYAVVFSVQETAHSIEVIKEILKNVQISLEENFAVKVCSVVSTVTQDAACLDQRYRECFEIRQFISAIGSDMSIITQADLDSGNNVLIDSNGEFMKQLEILINAILISKYDMIPTITEAILREYVISPANRTVPVQMRLDTISSVLIEGICSCNLEPSDFYQLSNRLREASGSADMLCAAVYEVYGKIDQIAPESLSSCFLEHACHYINENLSDSNLSLSVICEAAGCSVQHLSRLFRQQKDITINEYLNTQRIEQAKILLAESENNVYSIAEAVGYVSLDTFNRNFRRRVGLTPTKYRNLHRH